MKFTLQIDSVSEDNREASEQVGRILAELGERFQRNYDGADFHSATALIWSNQKRGHEDAESQSIGTFRFTPDADEESR